MLITDIYYGPLVREEGRRRRRRKKRANDKPSHRSRRLHCWRRKHCLPLDREFDFRK